MKDLFLIINATITFLAAIVSIISWVKINKENNDWEGRRKSILIGSFSSVIVLGMFTLLYFNYGKEILSPPTKPEPKEIIDISGEFTGYFTDDLGHQIPTFLIVNFNEYVDSIKMTFKNTHTITRNAIYFVDKQEIQIDNIGKGVVRSENGYVIIEAANNEITREWRFKKDLTSYY